MGLINTVSKLIPTAGLITGPMMLAAGLLWRIDEMPAAFMKANDGTGADKAEWAADLLGTTRTNVFILLGVCKVLALLDLWLLHVVQRVSHAKALRSQQPRRPTLELKGPIRWPLRAAPLGPRDDPHPA
tara:strand:+ start:128 stop:514 length:387 start_codon:yes stop_codon:yes gene_type:complete